MGNVNVKELGRRKLRDELVIREVQPNPKRAGSMACKNYAKYKPGMTVAQAVAAGIPRGSIRWDMARGHVSVAAPAAAAGSEA